MALLGFSTLTAVALLCFNSVLVYAQKPAYCANGIYAQLAPLSTVAVARSFCSLRVPPVAITSTVGATITTTLAASTITIAASTETITTTARSTSTSLISTTQTVDGRGQPLRKRQELALHARRAEAPTTLAIVTSTSTTPAAAVAHIEARQADRLSSLLVAAVSVVRSACTCINSTPTVRTTRTATSTATPQALTVTPAASTITTTTTEVTTVTSTTTIQSTPTPSTVRTAQGTCYQISFLRPGTGSFAQLGATDVADPPACAERCAANNAAECFYIAGACYTYVGSPPSPNTSQRWYYIRLQVDCSGLASG